VLFLLDFRFVLMMRTLRGQALRCLPDRGEPATLRNMFTRCKQFAAILLLAAACAGAQAAGAEAIEVVERRTFLPASAHAPGMPPPSGTHEFSLTLAYFTDSGWREGVLLEIATHAAGILAQCSVSVTSIEIARIAAPQRYRYFATPLSRQVARALQLPRPTVYFVIDTLQQPAYDAEAIGRGNSRTRPELADTVWITRATRDPGIALAHELAHVLMDSGEHIEEALNLMRAETTPANTRLNAGQCERLRATGTSNGLLRPAKN
jgi:hypothetical protein